MTAGRGLESMGRQHPTAVVLRAVRPGHVHGSVGNRHAIVSSADCRILPTPTASGFYETNLRVANRFTASSVEAGPDSESVVTMRVVPDHPRVRQVDAVWATFGTSLPALLIAFVRFL